MFNKFIRIFDVFSVFFVIFTNLYLSTFVLQLSLSHASGKIVFFWVGGSRPYPQTEAGKIVGGEPPSPPPPDRL